MNHAQGPSPLTQTPITQDKMTKWVEAQLKGDKMNIDIYGKPTEKQLKELETIRNLSKELQDNLQDLENYVRIADVENAAMNPTAPLPDTSEDHEFVSANKLDNCYGEEDLKDAREEEKRQLTKGNAIKTEIQSFYSNQCVFLTGGTGFLGKVLIEKILRSCADIDSVYVLIRSKKGQDGTSRLHAMLDDFLFEKAHEINSKGINKVIAVNGDMELPGLGISDADWKMLTSKVTIIINAAATVRFDEKLPIATAINVQGTKEVIRLARECRYLKAFTHVSTAFAHCKYKHIEEKFYDPPLSVAALESLCSVDEEILNEITPKLIGQYPNTYCFTKAVAEEAIKTYGEGMPICIFRPAIVVSTYEEPVRGWTDSMYGPTGIMIGTGTGVLRTMYMDVEKVADLVPVDLTVNAMLATAWYTAKNFKENQTSDIPIYNYVSGAQNPLTWKNFIDLNKKYGIDKPTTKAVWYYGLNPTKNYYLFLFYNFFLHYLPALLIDGYSTLRGNKRV